MRTPTLFLALAILGLLVMTPNAAAGHSGPTCTHEYVDHYKNLGEVIPNCVHNTLRWVWDFLGLDLVIDPWP